MIINVADKGSIRGLSSVKWLMKDESISVNEVGSFLKKFFYLKDPLQSVKFSVNEDYVVLLELRCRDIMSNYGEYGMFAILTHNDAREFLKIVKSNLEERANKMKRVVDGLDQPKTKTEPPPEIKLPPR